ncbi:MAG: APC family permease [Planctomycetota bacterium]|nr:APC family permease [Planctomycetota bacterium]
MADETTSSDPGKGTMKKTLGLTGLTSNAMALIAPGAFLWLTYSEQSAYGAPSAGSAMWLGIVFALLLCLATAVAYAELSKLYPGAGSSYFFAEQAFLSKKQAYKWARVYKFMVGWASHLYYWVYPGVMVTVTCIFVGYMAGQFFPNTFNVAEGSPLLMILFAIVFAYGVSYIAYRGVVGATGVNVAINVIQITALLIFSCMAITHRLHVKEGDPAYTLDSGGHATMYSQDTMPDTTKTIPDPKDATKQIQDPAATVPKVDTAGNSVWVQWAADDKGNALKDASGNPIVVPTDKDGKPIPPLPTGATKTTPAINTISYQGGMVQDAKGAWQFNYHDSAKSVIHWHKGTYVFIQACVAILILVGFESVTSMGEEARNAKRDIPKAVILSLIIQGGFCYLFEYFAANYFQSSAYTNQTAAGSPAPLGDMMQLVGAWVFGSPSAGWYFMVAQAVTVFLAMIGTTLSCINTGARVTYAMGRDEEVATHFGILHGTNATPHRCIWTLATISVFIGIFGVIFYLCGPAASAALDSNLSDAQKASIWYKGVFSYATAQKFPNSLLIITLVSNFGTFLLYMMSCFIAVVAFHEHHMHNFLKHKAIPVFGLLANLACMIFYLVGPFSVAGMSVKEPYIALGVAALWGLYGLIYFIGRSKKLGREVMISQPPTASIV